MKHHPIDQRRIVAGGIVTKLKQQLRDRMEVTEDCSFPSAAMSAKPLAERCKAIVALPYPCRFGYDTGGGEVSHVSPLLLVLGAALLWSTGGLFIKWTTLSAVELTFGLRPVMFVSTMRPAFFFPELISE